jgi:hypothetical protein
VTSPSGMPSRSRFLSRWLVCTRPPTAFWEDNSMADNVHVTSTSEGLAAAPEGPKVQRWHSRSSGAAGVHPSSGAGFVMKG